MIIQNDTGNNSNNTDVSGYLRPLKLILVILDAEEQPKTLMARTARHPVSMDGCLKKPICMYIYIYMHVYTHTIIYYIRYSMYILYL